MSDTPKLITFAPMIDSEVWRLLLSHYAMPYQEEPHAFIWGSLITLVKAGSVQVPAYCGEGWKLVDPDAALDAWDARQPSGHALIPADPIQRAIALDDWDNFHGTLATCTARLAYYHLLPHRRIMLEPFTRGIPRWEATLTHIIYPLQRLALSLGLQTTRKKAQEALTTIHTTFDKADARLSDGRPFLQGDRLTLSDIALATAAAPVTLPESGRSPIPPLHQMPAKFAAIVREMQDRPTARLTERVMRTVLPGQDEPSAHLRTG